MLVCYLTIIVPSPNCTWLLLPHTKIIPFDLTPKLDSYPADILTQLLSLPILVGLSSHLVNPVPKGSSELSPHAPNIITLKNF